MMYAKSVKFFAAHPHYNAIVHILAGIGIGILITHPFTDPHPLRWAFLFLLASAIGHLWTMKGKG